MKTKGNATETNWHKKNQNKDEKSYALIMRHDLVLQMPILKKK
jgi:hypothetical protein